MRRLSPARAMLASAVASLALAGCHGEEVDEQRAHVTLPSASFLAQEAPPAVGRPSGGGALGPRMDPNEAPGRYPFYWTRAVYSGYGRGFRRGGGGSWATDYPKGDRQFLIVLKRLVRLHAYDWENAVSLADPGIRRFPVIYAVEVGRMDLAEEEVTGLRRYLDAGGFLIVDDFWGSREWQQFEFNMRRVYPDKAIVDLPHDHPIFTAYYDIEEILQVPNINNAARGYQTHEGDGYVPYVRGIFDDKGRLQVIINWNTDLGDAWEWAESPYYPLMYSTFAYEMGANMIVYAMSH
ncbi:MAG: DUF4159 domain-containing protein [Gemmatimonadetes bacterium]|nr:DUF4159 domain-containing protein [Gemmatimonadota bacterium]MDA1104434.1 DUF4159 domain-containing protein [Gemmatimonadota bacterium]